MREKYKNNDAYLFPHIEDSNPVAWEEDGIHFYCNKEIVKKTRSNPMANQYKSATEEVIKTTTQLDFKNNDRVAFTQTPIHNADGSDFSVIISKEEKPYMERGNKFRKETYKEFWLTLS